jgi:hypothetical protein
MEYRIVTQEEYGDLRELDGIEIGIEYGIEYGIEIGRLTVAAKMKAEGLPIEIIKETTGLDDADYDLLEFLKFVENSTPEAAAASESKFVRMLSKRVQEINNTKFGVAYMKLQDNYDYYTELGEKCGEQRGIEIGRLIVAAKQWILNSLSS